MGGWGREDPTRGWSFGETVLARFCAVCLYFVDVDGVAVREVESMTVFVFVFLLVFGFMVQLNCLVLSDESQP